MKNSNLIKVLIVFIILTICLGGYILYGKIKDKKISNINKYDSLISTCQGEYKVDGEQYTLIQKVANNIFTETLHTSNGYKVINYKEEDYYYQTSCNNSLVIKKFNDKNNNKYLIVYSPFKYAKILMNSNGFSEILDITDYTTTTYQDKNTKEELDSIRIEGNTIYVIKQNCTGGDQNYKVREEKITVENGNYTKNFTGRDDMFEAIAGELC